MLRGKVDPTLSPDAKPPPVVDETPVRELADVTRGLPLSDATAEQVQALADSDRTPFALGQAVRTLLDGEDAPKGLVLEATRRATRWAKKKRADAPRTPRPPVGVAADLRKSPAGSWDEDNARSWDDAAPVLGPPPARNRAHHPFVGTIEFHGLPTIRVETAKGGTRSGTDADGKPWSVTMPAHYGEFARTEGADGDPVDVFVGPNRHAPKAYVVHLQDPTTGEHDEDKTFIGFDNADAARACFAAAYNRDDLQMGPMRTLTTSELAEWLAERDNRGAKLEAGRELHKAGSGLGDGMLHKGKHFKDEDKAQAAHKRVVEQYGLTEKDGERYWRLKSHIYEQMGGSFAKSDLPTSETAGTPAENRKPAAAAPPPAPPPVARPHHHAEAMQLPTKPTKRFPPPSHPKPTKAPRKLVETPPELTKAQQRNAADGLMHAAGLSHEVEIPDWLAWGIQAQETLLKGAGHKYIRRVPRPGGGYRYFYRVSGGKGGVGHESEFDVGAAFRVKDAGREGHFHVTGKAADGTLTIRHDETGTTHTLSASALSSMLRTEHAEAIGAHRAKLAQDLKDAKAAGASPKQIAKLEAEAEKHGVKPEPKKPATPPKPVELHSGKAWPTKTGGAIPGDVISGPRGVPHLVLSRSSTYIREEGLSLGLDDDRGWSVTYKARPLTDDERATWDAYKASVDAAKADTQQREAAFRAATAGGKEVSGAEDLALRTGATEIFREDKQYYPHSLWVSKDGQTAIRVMPAMDDFRVVAAPITPEVRAALDRLSAPPVKPMPMPYFSVPSEPPPPPPPPPPPAKSADGPKQSEEKKAAASTVKGPFSSSELSKFDKIVATGSTYEAKDVLKLNGFKWDGPNKAWVLKGPGLGMKERGQIANLTFNLARRGVSFQMHKSMSGAQRHEADALLKAAGVEPKQPAPKPRDQQRVVKATKDVGKVHERMQKLHTKAADEAANRGDGELSKLHADAAEAHGAAMHAHGAGLDGAEALSDKAKAATQATLDKHGAIATTSEAAKEGAATPKAKPAAKPAAAAPASGVGGRSKEGLKVIAIGPKGGKIVGYTTKDGKQKPIYEGSKAAAKLAATVEQHAPDAAPAAEAPADGEKPAAEAPPTAEAKPDAEPPAGDPQEKKPAPADEPPAGDDGTQPGGDAAPTAPPAGPSEPLDDKPLSPESQAGGEPADAPAPEDLGSASPKTDSPESRHAEEIAKMKGQVEEAHRKLEALAAHIDKNLVPMFNNLKSQARATHRNPSPSAVGWLVAQIGRFVSFVLGLHEDRSKTLSATDAIKGEGAEPTAETPPKKDPKKPVKRPRMKSGKQASDYMQKSLTAPGAENACVRVLVTLQAIERHHHAAHLQASGEDSYGDHLLFQRIYSDVQHEIDGLSEKMVAAFGKACVDADARAADAASLLSEWSESDDTLERALDAELQLQGTIEDALSEDVSPGLENFLQGLADSHEAAIYLLQQRIQPPDLVRSMQRSAADELLKAARALG